jgi:hypothetical protein
MNCYNFIVIALFIGVVLSWGKHPDVRTGKILVYLGQVILISTGSIFSIISIPVSYNISYDTQLSTNTVSAGLGIIGF